MARKLLKKVFSKEIDDDIQNPPVMSSETPNASSQLGRITYINNSFSTQQNARPPSLTLSQKSSATSTSETDPVPVPSFSKTIDKLHQNSSVDITQSMSGVSQQRRKTSTPAIKISQGSIIKMGNSKNLVGDIEKSTPSLNDFKEKKEKEGNKTVSIDESKTQQLALPKNNLSQELGAMPKIDFPSGLSGGEDEAEDGEDMKERKRRIVRKCRGGFRREEDNEIVVKYTKVYGENDGAYKNDSTPRGLVFMVNFTNYDGNKHPEREGSSKDYYNLLNLFQKMGYEVSHRSDKFCHTGYMTKQTFLEKLKAFSEEKRHKLLCSCIIIIMGHGSGPKTFVTSDNQEVDLMEVYAMLNNVKCQNLKGKPKIFILQFCRNIANPSSDTKNNSSILKHNSLRILIREEVQHAIEDHFSKKWSDGPSVPNIDVRSPRFRSLLEGTDDSSKSSFFMDQPGTQIDKYDCDLSISAKESPDASCNKYQSDTRNVQPQPPQEGLQRFSDMYSIFSTTSGEISHRDPKKGSLLIQAICHVFAEYAYQDEIDILVRKVSLYMTKTLQKDDPIQVPRQTCERTNNGLDKYFYFNPQLIAQCRHVTI